MKYFWLIVLLLIVLGVLWLRRRGTAGVAPARPTLGDRTPAESVTGAAAAADQGGGPASVFDPVEAPTAVAPATPVAPATAGQPQDQQPRRAARIEDADEASTTAPAPVDDAPADVASASQAAPGSAEEHTTEEPAEEEHTTGEPEEEEHTTEQHTTEQPSWTTSQWDPEHTVAEERGETDRPHFDDDVTEPASADETSEVHEDVVDADHADAPEDTVAASEEPGEAEEVPKSGQAEEAPKSGQAEEAPESGQAEEAPKSGQAEEAPESEDTEEAPVSGEAEEEGPDAGGAEQPSPSAETDASPRETIDDPALRQRGDWRVGEGEKAQVLTADDASDLGHGSSPDADSLDTESPETESLETDSADTESPETDSAETDSSSSREVSGDGPWQRRTSSLEEVRDGGYGVGSAATFPDRAMPLGHPVKAWEDTKSYVTPDDAAYDEAEPHLWFRDADAAQAAGFHPVD